MSFSCVHIDRKKQRQCLKVAMVNSSRPILTFKEENVDGGVLSMDRDQICFYIDSQFGRGSKAKTV
jgi:hypothetical protein